MIPYKPYLVENPGLSARPSLLMERTAPWALHCVNYLDWCSLHTETIYMQYIVYICSIYIDKALTRVLFGKYSTKRLVSRPIFECYNCHIARAKGSALSGIENVRFGAIHSSETIRNSPNSLEKQRSRSYSHCFCAVPYIPPLLGLISWVYWITCQYRTLGCSITTQYRTLFRFDLPTQSSLYIYMQCVKSCRRDDLKTIYLKLMVIQ